MRLGQALPHTADVTATVGMLAQMGMTSPEVMLNVYSLFEGQVSPFGSLLVKKGLTSRGLYTGMENKGNIQVLGNRKVKWALKGHPFRKGTIMTTVAGSTPGLNGVLFDLVLNTDWFGVNDDLELVDRRTLLHVHRKVNSGNNTTTYTVSLKYNQSGSYVEPTLLTAGKEVGYGHNSFPELSEDASEKSTNIEWHTEYMGIRRMKYTISGSAKATRRIIHHVDHKGAPIQAWDYQQNIDMYQRWAQMMEHVNIFGRATIDANDNVFLHDLDGRPIIDGNGLLAQGDPGLKWQYNTLSIDTIEEILENMQLMTKNSEGVYSVAVLCGQQFYMAFQRLMRDIFQQNPEVLFIPGADGNGVKTNFKYYEIGGARLELIPSMYFDKAWGPIERDSNGKSVTSGDAIFIALGDTVGGDPNIMLTTVGNGNEDRSFVKRIINGMTGNGPMVNEGATGAVKLASSPVDGMQVHILCENGIVVRNPYGIAELRKARRH